MSSPLSDPREHPEKCRHLPDVSEIIPGLCLPGRAHEYRHPPLPDFPKSGVTRPAVTHAEGPRGLPPGDSALFQEPQDGFPLIPRDKRPYFKYLLARTNIDPPRYPVRTGRLLNGARYDGKLRALHLPEMNGQRQALVLQKDPRDGRECLLQLPPHIVEGAPRCKRNQVSERHPRALHLETVIASVNDPRYPDSFFDIPQGSAADHRDPAPAGFRQPFEPCPHAEGEAGPLRIADAGRQGPVIIEKQIEKPLRQIRFELLPRFQKMPRLHSSPLFLLVVEGSDRVGDHDALFGKA